MKLSTRGRYAVTALFDLACFSDGQPITAADISKRQKISLTYLEQLLSKLKKHGIIKTVRGPHGGYLLVKKPSQVSIGQIIEAVEGPIALASCVKATAKCSKSSCCGTKGLWQELSAKVSKLFHETTLADLCRRAK